MRLPISAFVICQDEEAYIERCVRSLGMCSEIVIVDSGSTDRTLEILERLRAEGFPLRVLNERWRGYGGQKQFALEQCSQPWLLSIDSDERISRSLAADMPGLIAADGVTAWQVTRYPYLNGFGYVPPKTKERFNTRLFRKGSGHFDPSDKVHEGLHITGTVRKAPNGGLLHFRPIRLHDQMLKENKYSTLKAEMKAERGAPARAAKMLFSPPIYFLRLYFRHGLWRCGWAGVIAAMTGSVYSFLTEAKRWEAEAMARMPATEPVEEDLAGY